MANAAYLMSRRDKICVGISVPQVRNHQRGRKSFIPGAVANAAYLMSRRDKICVGIGVPQVRNHQRGRKSFIPGAVAITAYLSHRDKICVGNAKGISVTQVRNDFHSRQVTMQ